jgi:ATP-dependent DNA helicase PIF1
MSILDHFKFKDSSLTESQQIAYKEMLSGKNIFLTGQAGSGKSFLIDKYYNDAVKKHGITKVFKTSTTGVSALLISGRTIHSFMGIGIGTDKKEYIIKTMRPTTIKRIQAVKVLFIDEISMMNPDVLDKIYEIFVHFRPINETMFRDTENTDNDNNKNNTNNAENKFKLDIQFILSGDLAQLPVIKSTKQCFESKYWKNMVDSTVILREIVRQNDNIFRSLLSEVRLGIVSEKTKEILNSRKGVVLTNEYGILPTILYPTNNLVDFTNSKKLQELLNTGVETHKYIAQYRVISNNTKIMNSTLIEDFRKQSSVPDELVLAIGAQVIFKKNINEFIVNGSRGVVSSFVIKKLEKIPIVTLINGIKYECEPVEFRHTVRPDFEICKKQIPLKLAYATSIHASQGSSIDLLEIDIGSGIFEYGQAYVALSRCRTLEGLTIKNFDPTKIIANPKIVKFYAEK